MRFWQPLAALAASLVAVLSARAVIVAGGDGTQNTTPPANGSPWDHVGSINGATGIYLGNYSGSHWVITANHIGAGNFTLGGITYNLVPSSGVQIGIADLTVFQISSGPSLSNLALSATAPTNGSSVTMIGAGQNRATTTTTWYVDTDTNPYTWSTTVTGNSDSTAQGYTTGGGTTMRWGTNTISGTAAFSNTHLLATTFSSTTGSAQGSVGDSGGAMFYQNGGTWELAGVMAYVSTFSGQPSDSAVYGNQTLSANIAAYRTNILTAITPIPEPADVALWCSAAGVVALAIRRRQRNAKGR